jgi:hypothetical protein
MPGLPVTENPGPVVARRPMPRRPPHLGAAGSVARHLDVAAPRGPGGGAIAGFPRDRHAARAPRMVAAALARYPWPRRDSILFHHSIQTYDRYEAAPGSGCQAVAMVPADPRHRPGRLATHRIDPGCCRQRQGSGHEQDPARPSSASFPFSWLAGSRRGNAAPAGESVRKRVVPAQLAFTLQPAQQHRLAD